MKDKNIEMYNRMREVPTTAQKTIGGGRLKGFTDINPMWRIKKLTEEFGPCGDGWYIETLKTWKEEAADGVQIVQVEIALYYKLSNGEYSKPVIGLGGSQLVAKESKILYNDDEAYKKATTDAIGSACKLLGVGADIYWINDRTKYTAPENEFTPPAETKTKSKQAPEITELENAAISTLQIQEIMKLSTSKGIPMKQILSMAGKGLSELTSREGTDLIVTLQGKSDIQK